LYTQYLHQSGMSRKILKIGSKNGI
jgi:hypothetical protein